MQTKFLLCALFILPFSLYSQNNREWGTYYGGTATDYGYCVASDFAGNIYVAGYTSDTSASVFYSGGFQSAYGGGTNDAFLVKFDASGNRLWGTFYGGSGNDQGYALSTDAAGNVYLAGYTTSTNGIASAGAYQTSYGGGSYDAFIVKFDASGNRLWGTYYGGGNSSYGQALAVDSNGDLYFGGYTSDNAAGVIATTGSHQDVFGGGSYDAYLVKFTPSGSRIWGTYYGGGGTEGVFPPTTVPANNVELAIDGADAVYLCGFTSSNTNISSSNSVHQPAYGGGTYDGFLAKFTPAGTRIWGTYYGGTSVDEARSVHVHDNNLYLSGRTQSSSAIATAGAYDNTFGGGGTYDAFLVRFDTAGTRIWGTYYGDNVQEWGLYVTTDQEGNIYQVGRTSSTTGIASSDGFQNFYAGSVDAYVVKFDTSGNRDCATYYGGTAGDYGYSAVIINGKIYLGGYTASSTMIASGGYDNTYGGAPGSYDGFLVKFSSCIPASTSQVDPLCGNVCDGTGTVNPTGATLLPYSYLWSPGGQTTQTATGLCAGTYYVTVSDANGNTALDSVIITSPPALSTSVTTTNTSCSVNNGSATATVSGGVPSYTYSWTTSPVQTTATATGLGAATYTVIITDANGCNDTATASIFTINGPTVTISSQTNILCNDGNNGSATATASGGTPSYTFFWSTSPIQIGPTATGMTAGTYTVVVSDATGCTGVNLVTITQPAALTVSVVPNNGTCAGNNGSATANVSGGTASYTYSWTTSPVQTTATATGLSSGTYTVLVTDANGCTQTATATISSPTGPTATIVSQTNVSCNGGSNGSATTGISGGTAPFTFSWSTAPVQTTITATGLSAGNYTVIVTDANLCTASTTVAITQPAAMTTTVTTTNATCGNSDGSASVAVSNGTSPYTYNWSTFPVQTTATATALAAGIYTVTITDANGCTINATATVVNSNGPTASISSQTNVSCNGGNNGSATSSVTGGTSPYTYNWSPSGGTNAAATGLSAGTYTITVTDAAGCTGVSSATITEPTAITVSVSATNATCSNNDGSATATVSGGTSPYTYSWSTSPVQTTATATGLGAGTYTITITDANGCTQTSTAAINSTSGITASILSQTNTTCNGGNDGSATASASGGTFPYTYLWSTTPAQTTNTATGLSAGTYSVTVTDAAGCSGVTTVIITEPAAIAVGISQIPATCGNNDGSATASANNGTAPYTYVWNVGQTAATATGLSAGNYTVTVTDANGCTQTAMTIVTNLNGPIASILSQSNVSCNGGNDGSATATATGATPPYTYIWSTTPAQTGATATGLSAGMYTVTVTDAGGCMNIAIVAITQPSAIIVSTTPSTASCPACCDAVATASASGGTTPYSYLWNNGQTAFTATGLCAATAYTVCVTDGKGCTSCDTVTIPFNNPTAVQFLISDFQFLIYPNPANAYINIEGNSLSFGEGRGGVVEVCIVNIFGQQLIKKYIFANGNFSERINTEELSQGVYFVTVRSGAITKNIKLIIQ